MFQIGVTPYGILAAIVYSLGGALLLVCLGCIAHQVHANWGRIERKRRRFSSRPPIPIEEIPHAFFPNAHAGPEAVRRAWVEAANVLRLDPERLRPGDRFGGDLGPVEGAVGFDESDFLIEDLWFARRGTPAPFPPTLAEYVLEMAQLSEAGK